MIEYSYKTIQSLRYAKHRKFYNKFVIEGKRIVESALVCNVKISTIFCSDNFLKENKSWAQKYLNKGTTIKTIDKKTFFKICNTKSPQGILAVCDMPKQNPIKLTIDRWVYLDKISDPGNMGTLIRSCAWFGIKNIALSHKCTDPYNPKSIRASMGAHFVVNIHTNTDLSIFKKTHRIIAADLRGENASAYDFPKKCVLVLGSEAHGISKQNLDYIEDFIFINKLGSGNSLNVSTAGSILIYLLTNKLNF